MDASCRCVEQSNGILAFAALMEDALRHGTWLCLPSNIQRPAANMQVVKGSCCCSWWWTLALLTWEEELQENDEEW